MSASQERHSRGDRPGVTSPAGLVPRSPLRLLDLLPAVSLVGYSVVLLALSRELDGDASTRGHVEWWSTGASVVAGALYLVAMFTRRAHLGRRALAWTLGAAFVARVIVSSAPPILESDFYRYFWDGAVASHGINPFTHAPGDVLDGTVDGEDATLLRALAERSGGVVASVNHAHLTTIYPPLAQVAFAAAAVVDPFGATGWRCVLAAFDVLTMVLLVRLLRTLSLPTERVWLYAANPLLLRETYAALHMDVLLLPFLVGAVLCAVRSRAFLGGVLGVAGSAVKVWPAVLVPLLIAPLWGRWKRLTVACVVLTVLAAALWAPALGSLSQEQSGFAAYGKNWQNNDGFFRAGIWFCEWALAQLGIAQWHAHALMRWCSASLVLGIVLWQARLCRREPQAVPRRILLVVGAIFLLSPTQLPWYWIWCLPLLAVVPSPPLLLYTALLPLYYVQDSLPAVHWIEHAPVWGLLIVSAVKLLRARQANREPRLEVAGA
jgi:hypothetical protein